MNCAKCGMSMPPGSGTCPNCGLKIRQAPASSRPNATQPLPPQKGGAPGGAATPPMPGQPGQHVASQGPPNGAFAPEVRPPPSDPYVYSASPSDPYAQQVYSSPGEIPPLPPIGGPGAVSYKAKGDSSGKMVYILIGAIVLVLLVVGVLYFTVMRKSGSGGVGGVVGQYELVNDSGNDTIFHMIVDLKADGTYTITMKGSPPGSGVYKVEGGSVIMDPGESTEEKLKIEGDTLVQNSNGLRTEYKRIK